jgi:hypothetical protein
VADGCTSLSDSYTQIVVLCEDKQQAVFVRRFLIKCGESRHNIYIRSATPGRGAGEQFVREQYAAELAGYRRRATMLNLALVVVRDCDTRSLEDTRVALERARPRRPDDRIALLFPKRNIETWIHFLTDGEPVNEDDPYPKLRGRESECHAAVDRLAAKNEYRLSDDVPSHCEPRVRKSEESSLENVVSNCRSEGLMVSLSLTTRERGVFSELSRRTLAMTAPEAGAVKKDDSSVIGNAQTGSQQLSAGCLSNTPLCKSAPSDSGRCYPHWKSLRQRMVKNVCDLNKDCSIGGPSGCSR